MAAGVASLLEPPLLAHRAEEPGFPPRAASGEAAGLPRPAPSPGPEPTQRRGGSSPTALLLRARPSCASSDAPATASGPPGLVAAPPDPRSGRRARQVRGN